MWCQTVACRRRAGTAAKRGLTCYPKGPTILWIGIRLQTRFDDYPGRDPSFADLRRERDSDLDLNRGRLRGGRPLGADLLDVYFECDQPSGYLLDLRATLNLSEQLSRRVGIGSRISMVSALTPRTGSR